MGIKGRSVGLFYDGAMQDGGAPAVMLRFVDDEFHFCVLAIRIRLLRAPFKAEDLRSAIIEILEMDEDSAVCIKPDQAVSFMKHRDATNRRAHTRTLSRLPIGADLDVCHGHTAMHVREGP